MTKVLLDTDIGSDIDDAVCLAYLLANPDCELLGVTTVTGEAVKRAAMASALCKVAGKNVPVFPGADEPLLVPQKQREAPQAAALVRWPHESRFPKGEAVPFLRETIRKHPGEVVLLAIGPLTNVGLLFAADPEIPALLKSLVLMCGSFTEPARRKWALEWNAMGDPHATAIVYRGAARVHRSIGLDVTTRVTMEAAEVRQRFQRPLLRPVLDFAEVWFKAGRPVITFHDPLAAVTVFDGSVCRFARGRVDIEWAKPDSLGATLWAEGAAGGAHEVAVDVNPAAFFDRYFSVFE
jgi:purine nucleosidase